MYPVHRNLFYITFFKKIVHPIIFDSGFIPVNTTICSSMDFMGDAIKSHSRIPKHSHLHELPTKRISWKWEVIVFRNYL